MINDTLQQKASKLKVSIIWVQSYYILSKNSTVIYTSSNPDEILLFLDGYAWGYGIGFTEGYKVKK